jgi:hypothetical protein
MITVISLNSYRNLTDLLHEFRDLQVVVVSLIELVMNGSGTRFSALRCVRLLRVFSLAT